MRPLSRASLALPVAVVVAALVVPLLAERASEPEPAESVVAGVFRGRTAAEWEAVATRALDRGAHDRAIALLKSAERADPGKQYEERLKGARRARWAAREIKRRRERFLGSEIQELALEPGCGICSGHRTTVALPGESLWSIARAMVAAERGLLPVGIDARDAEVVRRWDALTEMNGVRELEVGETVLLPLPPDEMASLVRERRAEFEREARLLEEATTLVASARGAARLAEYGDRVSNFERALSLFQEAEAIAPGPQHAEAIEAVSRLLEDAGRYRVRADGSVLVSKPSGVAYAEAAREAVEWLIERRIVSSGKAFPESAAKTSDEIAWARLLRDAYERARAEGVDFETLVAAREGEAEFVIPNPAGYFVVASTSEPLSPAPQ